MHNLLKRARSENFLMFFCSHRYFFPGQQKSERKNPNVVTGWRKGKGNFFFALAQVRNTSACLTIIAPRKQQQMLLHHESEEQELVALEGKCVFVCRTIALFFLSSVVDESSPNRKRKKNAHGMLSHNTTYTHTVK